MDYKEYTEMQVYYTNENYTYDTYTSNNTLINDISINEFANNWNNYSLAMIKIQNNDNITFVPISSIEFLRFK